MEKKLITFEWLQDLHCESCEEYGTGCDEGSHNCPIWQNIESPEEKITIVPANGAKRNGWM